MDERLHHAIARAAGSPPAAAEPRDVRGYTLNRRLVVRLEDGRSVFVKASVDEPTAAWLRDELRVYEAVRAPFLPRLEGWDDDGELPVLMLEDLSGAEHAPPWIGERIEAVLETLRAVAATPPPAGLPRLQDWAAEWAARWDAVVEDPEPFLSLGLCSRDWLDQALPVLRAAAREIAVDGEALLHVDVRSDNLLFRDGRAVLVDWNWAAVGDPVFERACWAPSLHVEGGPPPEAVAADAPPAIPALLAGFWAAVAGTPPPTGAPRVRTVQRAQLSIALPWAARALGLPEPA